MFIVIGARDFSPEITVHLIGTKVPCFDKVPPPITSHLSSSVLKLWDTCGKNLSVYQILLEMAKWVC